MGADRQPKVLIIAHLTKSAFLLALKDPVLAFVTDKELSYSRRQTSRGPIWRLSSRPTVRLPAWTYLSSGRVRRALLRPSP